MKKNLLSLSLFILVIQTFAQVPSYVPTDGLVGYWPFNGDAADESGNGNNGTVNGATLTADRNGVENAAYSFDGASSLIEFNLNSIENTFSANIASTSILWVKTLDNDAPLISMQGTGGYEYNINIGTLADILQNPGLIGALVRDNCCGLGNNVFSESVNDNEWHQIALIRSSEGILNFYIDGIYINSSNTGNSGLLAFDYLTFGANQSWIIGTQNGCQSCNSIDQQHLDGFLDDIGIWNRALTEEEIQLLYTGCSVDPTAIVGENAPLNFTTSNYFCNDNPGSTFTWEVSNGIISSGQGTNSIVVLWGNEGAGTVSVVETNAEGCDGPAASFIVNVQCSSNITSIEGNIAPLVLSPTTYTVNGPAESTYAWSVTNGVISSGQGTNSVNVIWAAEGEGTLSVIETTDTGCESTEVTITTNAIITSVFEEELTILNLYPNPSSDRITLQCDATLMGEEYAIYDVLGREIMRGKITNTSTDIDVKAWSAGEYVVRIGNKSVKAVRR